MCILRNILVLLCNHCCREKAIRITYSERLFVALDIQHAMRMRHTDVCGCPALPHFSTLYHKRHDLKKKYFGEHKICVLILSKAFFPATFLNL
jgi:hypothetical protein